MFKPYYALTPEIVKALMSIEADRQLIEDLPIDVGMLASLRETAKLAATHYSTQIEGNRLTPQQVAHAVAGAQLPGRERDVVEVKNYYLGLMEVERLAVRNNQKLSQSHIQTLHGYVMFGRSEPTPYRDGQNVIRDSQTGGIVYLPPEASDVPQLMNDLIDWINHEIKINRLAVPVIAALAHYQFATIHPYYDGNGRTARLLTTLILHKSGYGLKGIYSLEEYYAQDLSAYYRALSVGDSHNYYQRRAESDVTGFVLYFCQGMAEAFRAVRIKARSAADRGVRDQSTQLRQLDPRERRLLILFRRQGTANTTEIADFLNLSVRTVVVLCRHWVEKEFLTLHNPSKKNRSYRLADPFERLLYEQQSE